MAVTWPLHDEAGEEGRRGVPVRSGWRRHIALRSRGGCAAAVRRLCGGCVAVAGGGRVPARRGRGVGGGARCVYQEVATIGLPSGVFPTRRTAPAARARSTTHLRGGDAAVARRLWWACGCTAACRLLRGGYTTPRARGDGAMGRRGEGAKGRRGDGAPAGAAAQRGGDGRARDDLGGVPAQGGTRRPHTVLKRLSCASRQVGRRLHRGCTSGRARRPRGGACTPAKKEGAWTGAKLNHELTVKPPRHE